MQLVKESEVLSYLPAMRPRRSLTNPTQRAGQSAQPTDQPDAQMPAI